MNLFYAILLGILQGATEFLPISSSGHLALVEHFLSLENAGLAFDVALHLGTLIGVIIYFRRDLSRMLVAVISPNKGDGETAVYRSMAWYLCLGTVPAVLAGLLVKDVVETVFRSPYSVAAALAGAGLFLLWADRKGKHLRDMKSIGPADAIFVGLFQAVALIPGISRSGITMTAGLMMGLNRMAAARFSFLLSVPVIFGAGIYKLPDIINQGSQPGQISFYLAGFSAAAVSGYLVIAFLMRFIQTHSFAVFVYYRLVLAALVVLVQVL